MNLQVDALCSEASKHYYWAHFKKGAYFESSMTSVVMLSET